MSQENVDLVRNVTDAWNAGGIDAVLPFYSEDVVWYAFPDAPDGATSFRGHAGLRELAAGWSDSFDSYTIVSHELRDLGDAIVALGEMVGVMKGSDATVRQQMGTVTKDFRGGRIGETRFFLTWEATLEAAGLSE
jgi:ketosteroid isomerase-like protein